MADHMYKLSEIPKKQRFLHFLEYYKFQTIIVLVVVIISVSMIKAAFFTPSPDNSIVIATSKFVPLDAWGKLESEFYGFACDYNEDGKTLLDLNVNTLDTSNDIDFQHYAIANQKFISTLATDEYIIQVVDETLFKFLKEERLIGTYAEFDGYNTGKSADEDVKIPLSSIEGFKESAALLPSDYYITIRNRFSSHVEGSEKKIENYENHVDFVAKIAGFEKK